MIGSAGLVLRLAAIAGALAAVALAAVPAAFPHGRADSAVDARSALPGGVVAAGPDRRRGVPVPAVKALRHAARLLRPAVRSRVRRHVAWIPRVHAEPLPAARSGPAAPGRGAGVGRAAWLVAFVALLVGLAGLAGAAARRRAIDSVSLSGETASRPWSTDAVEAELQEILRVEVARREALDR